MLGSEEEREKIGKGLPFSWFRRMFSKIAFLLLSGEKSVGWEDMACSEDVIFT